MNQIETQKIINCLKDVPAWIAMLLFREIPDEIPVDGLNAARNWVDPDMRHQINKVVIWTRQALDDRRFLAALER